jgi:FMN phosphatase YigB (HAD superfamily)
MKWLFWDLGDTILNEDPLRFAFYRFLYDALREEGYPGTFRDLLTEREQLIRNGVYATHYAIARKRLSDTGYTQWAELVKRFGEGEGRQLVIPVAGIIDLLRNLSNDWRMGIIADQPESALDTLDRFGIRDLFSVTALSATVGVNKPDRGIFEHALSEAKCPANYAVMIGNRYDMDIAPAKRLGMRTVFLYLSPREKGWMPSDSNARDYVGSLTRVPNWPTELVPSDSRHRSTALATSCDGLHRALRDVKRTSIR